MAPRRKCLICGSRQWRKNAVGLVTCSEGHVLQHYVNESEEADDVGTHMMRKRTLKSNRKNKERTSRADANLYHGNRARFLYYQCLQLLFRRQVAALIALWNLPSEFETICRDLWAFHVNLLPNPPPAEPIYYIRDQEGHQREPEEDGNMGNGHSKPEGGADTRPRNVSLVPDGNSSGEDDLLAPEIAVLVEDNWTVSSSDDEYSGDDPATKNMHISSKTSLVSRADRPENTIAVLVLACWTIRLPVVYMDFISAIESHSIPYLDHVRYLPSSLTRHLTKHAIQALSPHYAPRTLSLHRLASRLADRFYDTFNIVIPALNGAPVLWRAVQECFGGPPLLYALTKRVGDVLSLGLSLHGSSGHSLCSARRGDVESQKHDNAPPEVSFVASAIVVLKLVYGLDGKARLPRSSADAACALPAVAELLTAVREADHAEGRVDSRRFGSRASSLSVADLDDAALDGYLDFCQEVLVGPKGDGGSREIRDERDDAEDRILDRYFPLSDGRSSDAAGAERPCPGGRSVASTRDGEGVAPGETYTIYDAKDVLGSLPGDLGVVVERGARWAGIDGDVLCGVVERYERRLVRVGGGDREAMRVRPRRVAGSPAR